MGSRLGRRVVHFANLPIKLLMPTTTNTAATTSIREFAIKTIPSATKFEIKSVLESLYGFDVDEVRTLNMEGKKKKRGGILIAKPDYKKAYVTLRAPLSLSPNLFPIPQIEEERRRTKQQQQRPGKTSVVEEREGNKHWLDRGEDEAAELGRDRWDRERRSGLLKFVPDRRRSGGRGSGGGGGGGGGTGGPRSDGGRKFPWSSMRPIRYD